MTREEINERILRAAMCHEATMPGDAFRELLALALDGCKWREAKTALHGEANLKAYIERGKLGVEQ